MGLFDRFKKKEAAAGADREVADLVARLKHAEWQARYEAATALGDLGARSLPAVPALEEAISDDNGEVCVAASDALSKIRRATQ
jgi:HEAT repeat protein